ncbi:MAG: pilus assembly protein PilM [Nitrospirae bacterium]|nr:pilus assembly protein PilM [Nitrospirota bacterium]
MAAKKFSLKDSPIFKSTTVPKPVKPEEPTPAPETASPEPDKEQKKVVSPKAVKEKVPDVASFITLSGISVGKILGISRRVTALDITADKVVMVELVYTPTGARLDKFGMASLSRQKEGEREKEVIKTIKKVLQTSGINPKNVIVTIPGNLINHALLTFPLMPKKELHNALQREVKQHSTVPYEDTIVSYLSLGEISQKGIPKQNILLIMTSKTGMRHYLALMKECGIFPTAISTSQIAFYNLWQKTSLARKDKAIALVEIKGSTVTVNICKDDQLYVSRTIQIPGRENLEIFLSRVRVELDRSFLYYKQQFRGETVEKILLSEDSEDIKTIAEVLSDNLRMEVEEFDPLQLVSVRKELLDDLPSSPSVLTTAIGLAIEKNPRKRKRVNLLPEEIQERAQRIAKRISLGISGLALVTLLFLTYWGLDTTSRSYHQLLANQEERLLQMKPLITKYEVFEKKERIRQKEVGLIERITKGSPPWSLILQDLSNTVPKKIFLREVSIIEEDSRTGRNWQLTIRGEILKEGTSGWRGPLAVLLSNLKKSAFLKEVVLEPLQEEGPSVLETEEPKKTMSFTIRCLLNL